MQSTKTRPRPVVLVVLDGLGDRARTTVLSSVEQHRPRAFIATTDISRIDGAVDGGVDGEGLSTNAVIRRIVDQARDFGGRLHLIGLVSDGGVHSSLRHLFALIDVARNVRVRVVVHAILDGRDVPPKTAPRYIAELESKLAGGVGRIGTVGGRFWGMDGDNRWDRIQKFYRAILAAEVYRADSALRGIEQSYDADKTDEIVEPFVVFDYPGVSPVDAAIHFNLRPDGARQLTRALAGARFDHFARKGGRPPFANRYACLTTHDPSSGLPVAFPDEPYPNVLAELLARAGYEQFGGAGTAACVAQETEDAIRSGKYDFVLAHLASPDMGEAADAGLGKVVEAARSVGGAVVITGDPGTGARPEGVPLLYVNDAEPNARIREGGRLCDVAPTLLDLLQLPQPIEMPGRSLLEP